MHFSTAVTTVLAASFVTLVAGEACVFSGPGDRIAAAVNCCYFVRGKIFGSTPYQGICVFPKANETNYLGCFNYNYKNNPNGYEPICIDCDETKDCGLSA